MNGPESEYKKDGAIISGGIRVSGGGIRVITHLVKQRPDFVKSPLHGKPHPSRDWPHIG